MKILLAEDDSSIQLIAKLTLTKLGGHDVTIVDDGLAAIDLARKKNFDLILLDGMMPKLDGLETCRRLKEMPETKNIPVIFMTAKNQQSDIDGGYGVGAIGYIVKPFDAQQLCDELKRIYEGWLFQGRAA
jgi:CheY-like chemotaxis protein